MIAYLDTSVILRKIFSESNSLKEWPQIKEAFVSRLMLTEVGRSIDRIRLVSNRNDLAVADFHHEFRRLLPSIHIVDISESILVRAGGPMPTNIGTLDAIHLATALYISENVEGELYLATHDDQLARATRACGMQVCGA